MRQDNLRTSNMLTVKGKIISEFVYSHEIFGESFFNFNLEVPRLSEIADVLPVTISERLITTDDFVIGAWIVINGQMRSYNSFSEIEQQSRLILTIFAKEYYMASENDSKSLNEVDLDGFVCKPPVFRTTPFGREITDLLIAVNRSFNKSDYIPCITWGRNAKFASKISIGDNIKISGRMQSRSYQKKIKEDEFIKRTAYELSVSRLEMVNKISSKPNLLSKIT